MSIFSKYQGKQPQSKDEIQERFLEFHRANPQVYMHLVGLTREAISAGVRPGIRMVWEKLRWDLTVATTGDSGFKLNDHFHSRYARLMMEKEPDLRGLFDLRPLKSEK